jgi:hypothetical protein
MCPASWRPLNGTPILGAIEIGPFRLSRISIRDGEQAVDSYAGTMEGKARFRTALIAKQGAARRAECSVKPETMAPHAL